MLSGKRFNAIQNARFYFVVSQYIPCDFPKFCERTRYRLRTTWKARRCSHEYTDCYGLILFYDIFVDFEYLLNFKVKHIKPNARKITLVCM